MLDAASDKASQLRQYILITGNYWAFTLTDGALRMLVVLHFHQLGFAPLDIALLFLFYEAFGVVTNLVGGWLGARLGLNRIMNIGLFLQIVALCFLLVPTNYLTVAWVMLAQALSGVAKDLNKMSAKSSIKLLLPKDQGARLFRWVAILTGSKNTLKGVGFFLGGLLLSVLGFRGALLAMAGALSLVWLFSLFKLRQDIGRSVHKPNFTKIFSKSHSVNTLSAARMFLFGARDVWFVVALPVFLAHELQWSHSIVGGFLAIWVIIYGLVQSAAPAFFNTWGGGEPNGRTAFRLALLLAATPFLIVAGLYFHWPLQPTIILGLLIFGAVFAFNSAVHSYLIVRYASRQNVSLDVGFYYMANAMGRLIGTVLSGVLYQLYGLEVCLLVSGVFITMSALLSLGLDTKSPTPLQR
jgi:predicted MFS family arabinose efflux permease